MARQPLKPVNTQLDPVALRPQARPVDAYVRPEMGQAPKTGAFLQALGQLSPAILGLGQELMRGPSPEEKAAQMSLAQVQSGHKTASELAKEIAENPNASPVYRQSLEKLRGHRLGTEAETWMASELAKGDPAQMDPDQLLRRYYTEVVQPAIGSNKFAAAGFSQAAASLPDRVRSAIEKSRTERTLAIRDDNLFAVMQNQLGKADPAQVPEIIRGLTTSSQFLALPKAGQDKLLSSVIESLSVQPGKEAIIAAIGSAPSSIEGVTLGQTLGPRFDAYQKRADAATKTEDRVNMNELLVTHGEAAAEGRLDVKQFAESTKDLRERGILKADTYLNLIRRNQAAQLRMVREAEKLQRDEAKQNIAANLLPYDVDAIREGRAADMIDHAETVAGKEFTVKGDERREAAFRAVAADIQRRVTSDPSIPDEQKGRMIREQQVALYGRNGEIEPLLKQRLTQMSNTTTFDEHNTAAVATYLPELAVAHKAAPGQVYAIFKEPHERTFVNSLIAAQEMGMEPRAAMAEAVRRRDMAQAGELPRMSQQMRQEVSEKAMRALNTNGWLPMTSNSPRNAQVLRSLIERHADYWYGAGAKGDQIAAKVGEAVKAHTVFVGGSYIDTMHLRVPAQEAQRVFMDAAEAVKETDARYKDSEITFVPVRPGSSSYRAMMIGPTGQPIALDGSDREFSDLVKLSREREAHKRNNTLREKQRRDAMKPRDRYYEDRPWLAKPAQ